MNASATLLYSDVHDRSWRTLRPGQALLAGADPRHPGAAAQAVRRCEGLSQLLDRVQEPERKFVRIEDSAGEVSGLQFVIHHDYGRWLIASVGSNASQAQPWGRSASNLLLGMPGVPLEPVVTLWMPEDHPGTVAVVQPDDLRPRPVRLPSEVAPEGGPRRPSTRARPRVEIGNAYRNAMLAKFTEALRFPALDRRPAPTTLSKAGRPSAAVAYVATTESRLRDLRKSINVRGADMHLLEALLDRGRVSLPALATTELDEELRAFHPEGTKIRDALQTILALTSDPSYS